MSEASLNRPPKARRAFRVGVVGHRLDRLPDDKTKLDTLHRTINTILAEVRHAVLASADEEFAALYTAETPILRAISPLAEGTDRIFADEALALGYELCCPMPFYQEEFEKDFTGKDALEENSLERFRAILENARKNAGLVIFELDGDRGHAPEAYGAAGRVVLNQSDLMIAVWDGDKARGGGGTVDTLHEALRYNVPLICIDANEPDQCRLLRTRADMTASSDHLSETHVASKHIPGLVTSIVHRELRLPPDDQPKEEPGGLMAFFGGLADSLVPGRPRPDKNVSPAEAYFAEQVSHVRSGRPWKLLRNLLGESWPPSWPAMSIEDFVEQIRKEWPVFSDPGPKPSPVANWINSQLRVAFGWSDGLANRYANAHRSDFIEAYLLAALAVLVAMAPVALPQFAEHLAVLPLLSPLQAVVAAARAHWSEILWAVLELLVLWRVLVLLYSRRRRQWHERWTDYRLLAELIRELRFMIPLGGGRPLPRIPPHLEVYGNPAQTWMYWHVRAIARQTGIPAARVTPDYVRDCVNFLEHVVGDDAGGQRGFHLRAAMRANNLDTRLRSIAGWLFKGTVIGVGLRLLLAITLRAPPLWLAEVNRLLLVTAAVLPAFGAALEGINNQGEFIRIAKRSAAMASGFHRFGVRITAMKKGRPPGLADVVPLSSIIAETMVAEVVDWRAVIIDRQ